MGNGAGIRKLAEKELNLSKELDLSAPSRFLDALIAQEVMGFPVMWLQCKMPSGIWTTVPHYSSDRGDALDLLKHLIPDYQGKPPASGSPFYLVNIEGHTGGAPTFPLAVCKAALLAAGLYGKEKVYVKPN